jgi:hypothetical protein
MFYGLLPATREGWISMLSGLTALVLYGTQMLFNWFAPGIEALQAFYSLIVLVLLSVAVGFMYTATRIASKFKVLKGEPTQVSLKVTFITFVIAVFVMFVVNGVSMTMSVDYATYTDNKLGMFTGLRMMSSITGGDINNLQNFALGLRQIISALFMVIPCLCATWGGLSVLTADSIDEAEGGILAIVAAFVVFIIVWVFKAIDVQLMSMFI